LSEELVMKLFKRMKSRISKRALIMIASETSLLKEMMVWVQLKNAFLL